MNVSHAELVAALAKPGADIAEELTPSDAHIMHMVLGLAGEVGELIDAIKKRIIYRKEIDRLNIIEELGDIEFYLEGLRQELGITRYECVVDNITKLCIRYPGVQYSDAAATTRADKQ